MWQDFIPYKCSNLPSGLQGGRAALKWYIEFRICYLIKLSIILMSPSLFLLKGIGFSMVLDSYGCLPKVLSFPENNSENHYCDYIITWLHSLLSIISFTALIYWHWSGVRVPILSGKRFPLQQSLIFLWSI